LAYCSAYAWLPDESLQFDTKQLANAPPLNISGSNDEGLDLPENFGYIDYSYVAAVDVTADAIPSLVRPFTEPNVLFSPNRSVGSIAATFRRSEDLGPSYKVNFTSIYFGCGLIQAGAALPLSCTVSFETDELVKQNYTSPGNGTLTQAVFDFGVSNGLAVRIEDFDPVAKFFGVRPTLFFDTFRYSIPGIKG
jgi:hypothetical protein